MDANRSARVPCAGLPRSAGTPPARPPPERSPAPRRPRRPPARSRFSALRARDFAPTEISTRESRASSDAGRHPEHQQQRGHREAAVVGRLRGRHLQVGHAGQHRQPERRRPPRRANSTHWSTRTTRHHNGVPDTPRSVVVTTRSSRSSRSANREVEAWRTDRTHGWARPLVTRRRRGRGRSSPPSPAGRRWWSASRTERRRSGPCRTCRGRGAAAAAGPAGAGRPTRSAASRWPDAPGWWWPGGRRRRRSGRRPRRSSASTRSAWSLGPSSRGSASPLCSRQPRGSGGDVAGRVGCGPTPCR